VTIPIRAYPERQQESVARRREREAMGGLGYLSAKDAVKKIERAEAIRLVKWDEKHGGGE